MAADGIKIPTTVKKQIPFLESSGMVIDDVEKAKVVFNSLVILHGCVNHIMIVWMFAAIYHCMNKIGDHNTTSDATWAVESLSVDIFRTFRHVIWKESGH